VPQFQQLCKHQLKKKLQFLLNAVVSSLFSGGKKENRKFNKGNDNEIVTAIDYIASVVGHKTQRRRVQNIQDFMRNEETTTRVKVTHLQFLNMESGLMMKVSTLLLYLFCYSCNSNVPNDKKIILAADREAPLGWIYLNIYSDSSFEFISTGLRSQSIYSGTIKITKDTFHFNYTDSIPAAGKTAILANKSISYLDGEYPEHIEVKLNDLQK
jgi:hypothetical protein